MADAPKTPKPGATKTKTHPTDSRLPMRPGDEAPQGTPGTGENVCRRCSGRGIVDGSPCPDCEGTGRVITGIGGA